MLTNVRNAAGVGDVPAQPGANAPDAKHAPDRARGIIRDVRSRARWVSDFEAFDAVRIFRPPPSEGEAPSFPIPPPSGAPEDPLAPPAAGPTVLDHPLTEAGAPVGNAHSFSHPGGAQSARRSEPPGLPPLAPLVPGSDLYATGGIKCHIVRTDTVPPGDPTLRKYRSRLFPTIFDEATRHYDGGIRWRDARTCLRRFGSKHRFRHAGS